ncbi:MAG: glycosyltransferase family 2 protein [Paucibacter sp.]|nr:glycosyltransferase family 2 protein [Roseateles sp.]
MANASFVIANAAQDFLTAVVATARPDSRVLDVIVSESRAMYAGDWTPVPARVLCKGGPGFHIEFARPTNARHLRVDVLHGGLTDLAVQTERVAPLDEAATRALLKRKRIVFVGCARQCGAATDATLARVAELGALFGDWSLVVFENDSTDDTAARIRAFAADQPVELIQEPGLKELLPERTARLAYGRNRLLERALEIGGDYVCVVDIDGLVTPEHPSVASFLSSFALESCWDAVFPVNAGMYYDVWALRHPVLCPRDYMRLGTVMDAALGQSLAVHFAASYVQIDLRLLQAWLPVDSAFGGMGLYKAAALAGARYIGLQEQREVCEHVTLHAQLRARGAALYINPHFVVASHGGEGNPVTHRP